MSDWDGVDRRAAEARLSAVETDSAVTRSMLQGHMETCERDGKATKETAERIEKKVDRNADAREAQHAALLVLINKMEKRLLYGVLAVAGLLVWEYVVKRIYMG